MTRYATGMTQRYRRTRGHEPLFHIVAERPFVDYLKALCNATFLVGPVEETSAPKPPFVVCKRCRAAEKTKKEATDVLGALETMLRIHPQDGCAGTECLCQQARDVYEQAKGG